MPPRATFDPVTVTDPRAVRIDDRAQLATGFVDAARRYWITVFPRVHHELSHWRERAGEIPDPVLRRLALDAQRKRGNVEGAAAFAAFAPRAHRAALVRAAVAFQAAYDYLDVLAEQPQGDPVAGARGLHEALLIALDTAGWVGTESPAAPGLDTAGWVGTESPAAPGLDTAGWVGTESPAAPVGTESRAARHPDYYASYPQREDNGYLAELVDTCRTALATLPSYAAVAAPARRAAERIVEFQSLNLAHGQGDHDALARWAGTMIPPGTDLRWWEAAAAGGSSLGVHALIAATADPALQPREVEAIDRAYFPWIGGLHSLLDHLVDRAQDAAVGERNLIDYYSSPQEAEDRMRALAERAAGAARALPRGRRHTIILAGMTGYYLSHAEASAPDARPIAEDVRAAIGGLVTPTLLVFKARRFAAGAAALAGSPSKSGRTIPDGQQAPIAVRARP
jgi:tetraprenyl-beta-curcumene synthase